MNEIVSVIVPIYNVENELSRCIDSIIGQTYPYLEIILVNDGSTDNSGALCQKYVEKDARIILIDKENGGLSDARNTGLMRASGTYVMYVDSDDYIELDTCEKLLRGMISKDVDFVVGSIREIRSKEVSYQRHTNIKPLEVYNTKDFIISSIEANEWFAPAVLNLYRRDFLIANNLYFIVGQYYEDMEMLPRLYLQAKKIVYVDFEFYNYVIREDSITTSASNIKKKTDAINNYICWRRIFDTVEDEVLQKYLYGFLIKCYLKSCMDHNITKWVLPDCNMKFILKYSLNMKEKVKALLFSMVPQFYVRIR